MAQYIIKHICFLQYINQNITLRAEDLSEVITLFYK